MDAVEELGRIYKRGGVGEGGLARLTDETGDDLAPTDETAVALTNASQKGAPQTYPFSFSGL